MTFNILKIKPKLPALPTKSCRIWPSLLLISLPAHPPDCAPSTLAFLLLLKHPRSCWRHWLLLFPGTLAFASSQSQLLLIIQITNQLHCLSPAMTTELFCLPYPGYFSDNISNYLALFVFVHLLPVRVHHEKCWAGRSTSWNQDCQEKYQ